MTRLQSARAPAAPRVLAAALLVALSTSLLSGCEAILVGAAVMGTGMVVTDRRSPGIQLEDQNIANKASTRVRELATLGRVNVSSYNRLVLITGEVPTENDKAAVERAVAGVENVRGTVNELAVMPNVGASTWSSDSVLLGKIKASLVDAKDLHANAFRVIVERGNVYLMGRVTEREANRAADIARSVSGVQKVIKVFEILTEEELAALGKAAQPKQ